MQRSTIDIREFQLHFARCDTIDIAFCQVLLAGASGLHHLVDGSVALFKELVSKVERHIVNALRLSECL